MKNKKTIGGKIWLLFILTIPTLIFGQNLKSIDPKKSEGHCDIPPCELVSFTAQKAEGKIYLNWLARSISNNYYFVLERSFDGDNYSVAYRKRCSVSPHDHQLLYTFVDDKYSSSENIYYRIKLHKIEVIDLECKIISLSPINMFEKDNNSSVIIRQPHHKIPLISKINITE